MMFDMTKRKGGGGDVYEMLVAANNNTLQSLPAITDLTVIRDYMFYKCSNITSADFTNITGIGTYSLSQVGIATAFFPNYLSGNVYNTFRSCANLETVVFAGGVNRIDTSAFETCSKLKEVDIATYNFSSLAANAFNNTPAMEALILRKSSVVPLMGPFASTSKLSSTATIYVPNDLVASYQSASNWSQYASRIVKIEGTIYENAYADGTPIPTT